jgi:MinD-like ATPase involved in chromosome partitioning or flagellar assembly
VTRDVTIARTLGPLARIFSSPRAEEDELVALDEAITRPLATSRRIAFLHLDGGVGCSTLAAGVVDVLASRRGRRAGRVAVVDAAGSLHGVGEASGVPAADRVTPASLVRASARRYADAVDGLSSTSSGALYVGLGRADSAHWPATGQEWGDEVDGIARFFDLVVTDWGRRVSRPTIAGIAESSHAVCLVSSSERASLERALAVAPAIAATPRVGGVMIAVVDRDGRGPTSVALDAGPVKPPIVFLPTDRGLSRGARPVDSSSAQRRGYLSIAAALVRAAAASDRVTL